jgi:hypothetical protein
MKKNWHVSKQDQPKILIAIIDGEQGKMVERYLKDTEDLDPYELKKLLQNVCDRILSEYRRDMLLGYARIQNLHIANVPL